MIVYFEKWTRRYWPTQADAKEAAREARVGGGEAAGWEQVNVPTTEGRDALCEFLNNLEDAARNTAVNDAVNRDVNEPVEVITRETPQDTRPVSAEQAAFSKRSMTTNEIVSFVLDDAQPNQAADILEAVLRRMKELRS